MLHNRTKTSILTGLLLMLSLCLYHQYAYAWGFWAHKRINRLAVFTLPPEMIGFYKKNIEFLTEHAIDPDKRRYASDGEAPRHYIDIDHHGEYPFDNVPRKWKDAVAKFSEDTLMAYGTSPWNIEKQLDRLTKAFVAGKTQRILQLSADLGHYIGDGHVPLHTTTNYNGQLTNQKGIHGFWESRVPELYGNDYDYWVGKATYIEEPNDYIWDFIFASHLAVDTVLTFERELTEKYPSDQKYCYEQRGAIMQKVYCEGFTQNYSEIMEGMVERRMRAAIQSVGSFWFTAWVNAGQPNLNRLGEAEMTDEEIAAQKELDQQVQTGKIKGREHGR